MDVQAVHIRNLAPVRLLAAARWGMGCHRHPVFSKVPRTNLTPTDALALRVLGQPFYDSLTRAEVDRVTACSP